MQREIARAETDRLHQMSWHEERLSRSGYRAVAGIDEAGRGPLAGPVVAAACILPAHFSLPYLNDSKQLSPQMREDLFKKITTRDGVVFGIGIVSNERIDAINILQATFEAMQIAVQNLAKTPDYLLIDGNRLPVLTIPKEGIVKGDAKSVSIAAASVLAKVTRDALMDEEAKKWPAYGFETHKGYGTEAHRRAIERWGPCPIHRQSFEPIKSWSKTLRDGSLSFFAY